MSNPRSLVFQLACLRDVKGHARSEEIAAGLQGLEATVEWLIKRRDVLQMVDDLRRGRPELYEIMTGIANEFPGSQIVGVGGYERHEQRAQEFRDPVLERRDASDGDCDEDEPRTE